MKRADAGRSSPSLPAPPPGCGEASFAPDRVPPDMMIVLDSSGSMQTGGVDRWAPSVGAVKKLTSAYDQEVGFGLLTFPLSNDKCGSGTVKVPIRVGASKEIATILDRTTPQGGTPTGPSLAATRKWFEQNASSGVDTVAGPRYVLLVTDGQPTCPVGVGARVNDEDKRAAVRELEALAAMDIKTFVVGYDAQLDAQFAKVLTEFAKAGKTDAYYPVKDEKSLVDAFEAILTAVTSCSFTFDEDVSDPSYLRVAIDGEQVKMDDPDGWRFDGKNVVLQGEACQRIQGSDDHEIEIKLECTPVL